MTTPSPYAHIKAISFDLDDTFWHTMPIIQRAESTLHHWLKTHYPRLTQSYSTEDFIRLRAQLAKEQPHIAHDLTALRIQTLQLAARACGYPESLAAEAFEVFIQARNEVELYEDVLPSLHLLSQHYILGALTNGNADVHRIGIGHHFDFTLSAIDVGAAKPDRLMFDTALQQAGVLAHEMIHVGDDHSSDIEGARAAGLMPIWINRHNETWDHATDAPCTIANLNELTQLLLP